MASSEIRFVFAASNLFNHLIRGGEQCWWEVEAERLRGPGIDGELEFDGRLNREFAGLFAPQDAMDIACGPPIVVGNIRAIG